MNLLNLEWKNPGRYEPVRRRRWYQLVTVLTVIAFGSSCTTWDVVPLTDLQAGRVIEPKARLRITRANDEQVLLEVDSLVFPNVTGTELELVGGSYLPKTDKDGKYSSVTVDLRQVKQVEVWTFSGWRTFFLVLGVIVVIWGIVALVIALTKTSCPFVYVDTGDGPKLVGESYSGATSRAVQREDLMPLPSLGARASVTLSNEAQEVQFTDSCGARPGRPPPGAARGRHPRGRAPSPRSGVSADVRRGSRWSRRREPRPGAGRAALGHGPLGGLTPARSTTA